MIKAVDLRDEMEMCRMAAILQEGRDDKFYVGILG